MNAPLEPTAAQEAQARLTAWAVDELSPPDASAFLTETAADPARQAEAVAARAFCALLESELRVPAFPAQPLRLPEAARARLLTAARQPQRPHRISFWMPSLAAAACVGVMFAVFAQNRSENGRKSTKPEAVSSLADAPDQPPAGAPESAPRELVIEARELAQRGAFDKARSQLQQVIGRDPANRDALRLLKDLEDPDRFHAAFVEKPILADAADTSEAERLLMRRGLGYYDLGQYADAGQQFNQVLALNPGNTAARRQLERTEKEVNNYYRAARDHTRIRMLHEGESAEETALGSLEPGAAQSADQLSALAGIGPSNWKEKPDLLSDLNRPAYPGNDQRGGVKLSAEGWATPVQGGRWFYIDPKQPEQKEPLRFSVDYGSLAEAPFQTVADRPLSTFSIDVDTASYAITRRHLNEGQRPPAEAVRLEEMINYFPMDDAPPADGKPFAVHVETASAPWKPEHRLVRVALKGKVPASDSRGPANLVFLVDTSGSMGQPNKLPLVQQSLQLLLAQLEPRDHVTLVTYAGESELKLPSTPVSQRATIAAAIEALTSGGSTNGSGGITTAYQQARAHFVAGGVNRVILATDGDFNVGLTSQDDLQALITREAKSGVYLSVLAYGSDNLKDTTAELLADKGNGNYAYIDSLSEARRALVTQLQGTLVTIAKDVKIQVEFNPAQVARYRLLGYENRALADKDFNDDTKDAGEIGAGHSVTALYEIVPVSLVSPTVTATNPLKYQTPPPSPAPSTTLTPEAATGELLTVKLRYQQPEGTSPSQLIEVPVKDPGTAWAAASANFRWTAAVAGYGLLLRGSAHAADLSWETIRALAAGSKGPDPDGFRGEFLQLIEKAASLAPAK